MKNRLRKRWIKFLANRLFNAVTEDDFLQAVGPDLYIGKEKLGEGNKRELTNAARTLKGMELWKLLMKQMKYAANKRMYTESNTELDIYFGKAMLYNVDVMEQKIDKLARM